MRENVIILEALLRVLASVYSKSSITAMNREGIGAEWILWKRFIILLDDTACTN